MEARHGILQQVLNFFVLLHVLMVLAFSACCNPILFALHLFNVAQI